MKRRCFLGGMVALAACDRDTVESIIPETVPGEGLDPLPDSLIDPVEIRDRLTLSLGGTGLEELGSDEVMERVDLELRAMAAVAPKSAELGVRTLEALVLPGLDVVSTLRERPDMDEEEMGALFASVFDMSQRRDSLLPAIADSDAELSDVGAATPQSREMVAGLLEDLGQVLRGQLAIADREDNAFARQMLHQLDLMALDVRTNLNGLSAQAVGALESAEEQPAGPPFAALCSNLNYASENVDRYRMALSQYFGVIASTATVTGLSVSTLTFAAFRVPFGGMLALLAGVGLVGLMMPFLSWSPPTVYKPLTYRMCDCEGNN